MAARVVVLPEPVGPVTRINPRCSSASLRTASGSPISWNEGPPNRSFRRTIEIEPRCRNTFARKRPTFATEYAKSTSPRSANVALRSCGTMPSAIACVSIGPSGSRSRRIKPWGNRIIGGDPTLTWRSDPSPLTSSSSHELNSGTIGAPVSISSLPGRSIVGRGAARRAFVPSARSEADFSPPGPAVVSVLASREPANGRPLGEGLERRHPEGRPRRGEHPLEQPVMHRAHERSMLVQQISERAITKRDLHRLLARTSEPRREPRPGEPVLQRGKVRTGRSFRARSRGGRMQRQADRQLTDRDRTTGEPEVPVQAVAGVLRECLVHLDRERLRHGAPRS